MWNREDWKLIYAFFAIHFYDRGRLKPTSSVREVKENIRFILFSFTFLIHIKVVVSLYTIVNHKHLSNLSSLSIISS
jgi:hypothetical protein